MEACDLTLSDESAERISLLCGVAMEHGSLVTLQELLPLMHSQVSEEELAEAIHSTPSLNARFDLTGGYMTEKSPKGDRDQAVLAERANRRSASENLLWAEKFARAARSIPFDVVAASGSTSYQSASKSKDIDFFCVSSRGEMWTSLTKALLLARTFGLLHRGSPRVCFSCVMDEDFAMSMFATERSPLFARDALQAVVLMGQARYRELLGRAPWMSAYFPRAYAEKVSARSERVGARPSQSPWKRALEMLIFLAAGVYIRVKSEMLNRKFARSKESDSTFNARVARDHLIYESMRYVMLRRRYAENLAFASLRRSSWEGRTAGQERRGPLG